MFNRKFSCMVQVLAVSVAIASSADAQVLGRASGAVRGSSGSHSRASTVSAASSAVRGSSGGHASGGYASGSGYNGWSGFGRRRLIWGAYPYALGSGGYAQYNDAPEVSARVAFRLGVEGGYALAGVGRVGVAARVQFPTLLDLSFAYSFFAEPRPDGGLETLALGRLGADMRVFDQPEFQLRLGAGLRHFHDRQGDVLGFDGALGFDAFFGSPLVLSTDLGVGRVGEALLVFARASVGVMIQSVELFAGYDYQALGSGESYVNLGGPMLGARLWR